MGHIDYKGYDGQIWPSATNLTALIPQDWKWSWYADSVKKRGWRGWQRNSAHTKREAQRGTDAHEIIDGIIEQRKVDIPLRRYERAIPFAKGLLDYSKTLIEEIIENDTHLVGNKSRIHGTTDVICRLNYEPGLWVLDWKTGDGKKDEHPLQLAAYAMAWNENHPDQVIDKGVIIRPVNKKAKTLKFTHDEYKGLHHYFPIVKALRDVWAYVNKKDQWEE